MGRCNSLACCKEEGEEEDVFVDSYLAYFAMLDRVLKYGFDEEGFLDRSKMSTEERAFAVCLQHLFDRTDTDDGWLLNKGITGQAIALHMGVALLSTREMSVAEAVQCIDEHRGGPEWRQICDKHKRRWTPSLKSQVSQKGLGRDNQPRVPGSKPGKNRSVKITF